MQAPNPGSDSNQGEAPRPRPPGSRSRAYRRPPAHCPRNHPAGTPLTSLRTRDRPSRDPLSCLTESSAQTRNLARVRTGAPLQLETLARSLSNQENTMSDRVFPCLWFNGDAEEAVSHYVSVMPNSHVVKVSRYGDSGPGRPGSVMTVIFELDGRRFMALNGGEDFPFSEAISIVVSCDTQAEIDRIWDRLADGGTPQHGGWIKDRYGLPWQIVPSTFEQLMTEGGPAAANRVMAAVMKMVKLDLAAMERAYIGETRD